MPDEESIKGVLMMGAVATGRLLLESGRVDRAALEARLSQRAIELIDEQKIELSRWYPIRHFCEIVDADWDISAGRDPAYQEARGRTAADRLFESGIYQQLEFAERSGKVASRGGLRRQAKLITSMVASLYSFLETEVEVTKQSLVIHFRNAAAFCEPLVHSTAGFMNQINERQGSKRCFRGERVSPDHVCFTMDLPDRFFEEQ